MASTLLALLGGASAWAASLFGLRNPLLARSVSNYPTWPADLAAVLSTNAQIHHPGSSGFDDATKRWSPWKNPSFDIVVEVATEGDVEHAIQYANSHDKPFLAVSGTHGATLALNNVQHGVGIWMKNLVDVKVAEDGLSATIGGGIKSKELLHALWAEGKHSVAGACECTGVVAPMLGGGHGWLQGRYGLMGDNLISARMVTANSTAITVSQDENPDLFWAIRGAGHNFGIVTSFEYKVYDHTPENENWNVDMMIFTADKFEEVHKIAKGMLGSEGKDMPVELVHVVLWAWNADVDPDRPVILFLILYQGQETPTKYTKPLTSLSPIMHNTVLTNLIGIAPVIGFSNSDPACQKGDTLLRFPVNLETYDVPGLRRAFDVFSNISDPFRPSMMILEAYSVHAVQAVDGESTAYPDRGNGLLLAPFIWHSQPPSEALDAQATEIGRGIRDAIVEASGKPLSAYLNYAYGDESLEAMYGYEGWRLEKLRRLKGIWDPEGRFGFYNPIR